VLAEQKIPLEMDDYLKLLPNQHQTDGFFAAVLERKKIPVLASPKDQEILTEEEPSPEQS
jgi:16S rRNA (cytosine967-C5)-methyltransferase